METARDGGALAGDPVTFATNQLVLVVPAGNPAGITGLDAGIIVVNEGVWRQDNATLTDVSALSRVTQLGAVHVEGETRFDLTCAFTGAASAAELTLRRTPFEVVPWPRTLTNIESLFIVENEGLADLGESNLAVADGLIAFNDPLRNADVEAWLAQRVVEGVVKYGANAAAFR